MIFNYIGGYDLIFKSESLHKFVSSWESPNELHINNTIAVLLCIMQYLTVIYEFDF